MFQIKCCVFNLSVLFFGLVGCFEVCSLPDLNLKQQFQVVKSVLLHFIDNSTCIYGRLDEMLSELWFIEALKVPPPL